MSQISAKLRRSTDGYSHWCDGCKEMHGIRTEGGVHPMWTFDGNVDAPTFSPSVNISWEDPDGEIPTERCHYILTAGIIQYCGDCTHALVGQNVPLPDLPVN